ncbi:MAG: hypothetical protein GY820_25005 [Gammaproteobacteria bacterium]|nr:hypothetical protein [Gammaproteobacteria bacterium]
MSPRIAQKEPVRKIPVKNDPLSTPLPNSEALRSINPSPGMAQKEPVRKIPVKNDPRSTSLPNSEALRSINLSPKIAQEPVGKIPVINDPPSKSLPDIQRYAKKVSDQASPQSSAKIQYGASPPEHRGRYQGCYICLSPYHFAKFCGQRKYSTPQGTPYYSTPQGRSPQNLQKPRFIPYSPLQNPLYIPHSPPQNSPYMPYRPPQNIPYIPYSTPLSIGIQVREMRQEIAALKELLSTVVEQRFEKIERKSIATQTTCTGRELPDPQEKVTKHARVKNKAKNELSEVASKGSTPLKTASKTVVKVAKHCPQAKHGPQKHGPQRLSSKTAFPQTVSSVPKQCPQAVIVTKMAKHSSPKQRSEEKAIFDKAMSQTNGDSNLVGRKSPECGIPIAKLRQKISPVRKARAKCSKDCCVHLSNDSIQSRQTSPKLIGLDYAQNRMANDHDYGSPRKGPRMKLAYIFFA